MLSENALRGDGVALTIGGLSRTELLASLDRRGVSLNAFAELLFAHSSFDVPGAIRTITLTERTVAELGLAGGGSLSAVFAAAGELGLHLCPLETAAYLRLALTEQTTAPDSIMTAGRAPRGSLTVASQVLTDDDEYPKGFYLRIIDGQPWLRGYRCDDLHMWSPQDRLVFAMDSGSASGA